MNFLAWLMIVAAIMVAVLLLSGRPGGRDVELEEALRWQRRQARRASRRASRAAAHAQPSQPRPADPAARLRAADAAANRREARGLLDLAAPDAQAQLLAEAPRSGRADDLTRIKGLEPAHARLLRDAGIVRFRQIAAWTQDEVVQMDELLAGLGANCLRDDWVGQARLLAGGDGSERAAMNGSA